MHVQTLFRRNNQYQNGLEFDAYAFVNFDDSTSFKPWNCVLHMGTTSHRGIIIAPGQDANGEKIKGLFDIL